MKVLSLWQPWASLWAWGDKTIETRSWGTSYRGPVAVHASLRFDKLIAATCFAPPFIDVLCARGIPTPQVLPRGCIIGIVNVTDVVRMVSGMAPVLVPLPHPERIDIWPGADPRLTHNERAFGIYAKGRHAWLTDPKDRLVFKQPIGVRGTQGLRDLDPEMDERLTKLWAAR